MTGKKYDFYGEEKTPQQQLHDISQAYSPKSFALLSAYQVQPKPGKVKVQTTPSTPKDQADWRAALEARRKRIQEILARIYGGM